MSISYSHLSAAERHLIGAGVASGISIRQIARQLGRPASTVSREIKRNTWLPSNQAEAYRPYRPNRLKTGPWTNRYYVSGEAQHKAERRQAEPRKPRRMASDRLCAQVARGLRAGWSPAAISGWLTLAWPDDPSMRVCAESVYRWIYSTKARTHEWAQYLSRAHRRRRKAQGRRGKGPTIIRRTPISQRPENVNTREQFSHWEADSVIGSGAANLHTEVERKTRFLIVRKVTDKSAANTISAQLAIFTALPAAARLSVTCDNGTEFARHYELTDTLGMNTWFADPYSSWQRGSNENRNGILRRYLPKSTNLDNLDETELQTIVDTINNTPPKSHKLENTRPSMARRNRQPTTIKPTTTIALVNRQRAAPPYLTCTIEWHSGSAFR
ncbi:IS30 family transposase [Bombiscardovia nodaiensis]|uniref:IS30 family transposase n=1 Tax=Bombiscardovia nodaiensis TaxID=2932181 RepID=A0ABM8BAC0_9BIFI|nr:IS30 family transposase [Bombiscardovia nodaiensis]